MRRHGLPELNQMNWLPNCTIGRLGGKKPPRTYYIMQFTLVSISLSTTKTPSSLPRNGVPPSSMFFNGPDFFERETRRPGHVKTPTS